MGGGGHGGTRVLPAFSLLFAGFGFGMADVRLAFFCSVPAVLLRLAG